LSKPKSKARGFEEPFIQIVKAGEKIELAENPILLVGFPGPGLVGVISTGRVIEAMGMKLIAAIRSPLIPPVTPFLGGEMRLPLRICASKDGKFITAISEVALPLETIFFVANKILDWAAKKGVRKVVCLEGVAVKSRDKRPMVFGAAEPHLLRNLEKYEIPKVQKGLVAGIAGALLNECLIRKLEGYCLLVPALVNSPDPEAAASMVTTLNRFLNLDVSIQPLIKNQSVIKAQLNPLAEQSRREERQTEEHGFRPIPFYV
jgi:uncharacterized protein